jgi:D12 class N6 adenine-specific DNA methyltransferase
MKKFRLKAPFPWFGGKSRVAHLVWERFGDVINYVEPFFGSGAVLLGRPTPARIETVNDLDCFIANFWRAVQNDPGGVALWADWPVNEADMHARHLWLVNQDEWRARIKKDPEYFDVKIAGWWVWGISQWIGGGWCSRPEWSGRINVSRAEKGIHQQDVSWRSRPAMKSQGLTAHKNSAEWNQRPSLTENGVHTLQRRPRISGYADAGVHSAREPRLAGQQMWHKRPVLKRECALGVNSTKQQVPDLGGDSGAAGRGLHASAGPMITDWMYALSDRLRRVRVCCGDWKRILGRSPTECIGLTGVFLDPPYSAARDTVYATDDRLVAHKVREWAIDHGDNPKLRIALCGYEGEHEMPLNWKVLSWKTNGGHGNAGAKDGRGRTNAALERIWFSPHCLEAHSPELAFV